MDLPRGAAPDRGALSCEDVTIPNGQEARLDECRSRRTSRSFGRPGNLSCCGDRRKETRVPPYQVLAGLRANSRQAGGSQAWARVVQRTFVEARGALACRPERHSWVGRSVRGGEGELSGLWRECSIQWAKQQSRCRRLADYRDSLCCSDEPLCCSTTGRIPNRAANMRELRPPRRTNPTPTVIPLRGCVNAR